jgi:outer membrane protein TolC
MDMADALAYALRHSREYRFEEEEYVLAALRLLSERHLWGPRFFNDLDVTAQAVGDGGLYDSSVRVINDFRVTQRLPYGGEVSARVLAAATEDLHFRVADEKIQTAEIILSADVPLLRGAGTVAQEDLIQAERNLIYAARDFERFRREFLFDIAQDFLALVVQRQSISNAQQQIRAFQDSEARARALVDAGRQPPPDAARAAQDTREAIDNLNVRWDAFLLSVDRFKVRLGMPEDDPLMIVESTLGLPAPQVDMDQAMRAALSYRLDLQNRRDRLDDAHRAVDNAFNNLLPDLDLGGSVTIPTEDERERAGLHFDPDDTTFTGSITFGLPLDRGIERINVRQSQIDLERAIRDYGRFRDTVAVEARSSAREIDRARFSVDLQEENIRIAGVRQASIEAAPDRFDARDRSEAIDALNQAQDRFDSAQRDLQVGILRYLLDTGQLRVDSNGLIKPLRGMEVSEDEEGRQAPTPQPRPDGDQEVPPPVQPTPPPPQNLPATN